MKAEFYAVGPWKCVSFESFARIVLRSRDRGGFVVHCQTAHWNGAETRYDFAFCSGNYFRETFMTEAVTVFNKRCDDLNGELTTSAMSTFLNEYAPAV